jgi:cell division protein FtsB
MATGWREQYFRYKDFFLNIVSVYKQRRDIREFLELILSLSTVIIFVIFALKPTALTIISLYNQIQTKRATLNSLNQKISDLQKANSVFNQNQNFVPDIDAAIFTSPEPDTISKQILGLSSKDSIDLLGVSIGQVLLVGKNPTAKNSSDLTPLPENALSMPVSISFRGSYPNLLAFIKDLENLRIPIKIDSLTISSSQTQAGSTIVGVITARVPYLGQK